MSSIQNSMLIRVRCRLLRAEEGRGSDEQGLRS